MFYIQNRRPVGNCVSWWAEGGHGYTCDLEKAGKFTAEEAASIVKNRPDIDKAWSCEQVDALSVRHLDFQKFGSMTALAI